MSRGDLDPHEVRTAVKRKDSFCGTGRCMSAPPKRKHGHERDATQFQQSSAEVPRYRSRLVCSEVSHTGVEQIFSATPPLEALRVLLCVACQEDVYRVEDPFLISIADVSRAHFYADAEHDVNVRLPNEDPTRTQWEISQLYVKNYERRCTDPWMLLNGGENISPRFGRREDFREARLLRTISSTKAFQTYILLHGDDCFMVCRRERRKHTLSLFARCIRAEQSRNLHKTWCVTRVT